MSAAFLNASEIWADEFPSLALRGQIRALVPSPRRCEPRGSPTPACSSRRQGQPWREEKATSFAPRTGRTRLGGGEGGAGGGCLPSPPTGYVGGHPTAPRLLPHADQMRCAAFSSCNRGMGNSQIALENGAWRRFLCLAPCGSGVLPGCLLG